MSDEHLSNDLLSLIASIRRLPSDQSEYLPTALLIEILGALNRIEERISQQPTCGH